MDAVRISGIGDDARLPKLGSTRIAAELLMAGEPVRAARGVKTPGQAVSFGERVVRGFPSRNTDAVKFAEAVVRRWPDDVRLHRVFGDALVAAGRRQEALREYQLAHGDPAAERALRMLSSREASGLPFTLDELFQTPSRAEIDSVAGIWTHRDLRPRDVQLVASNGNVRIYSHRIT